MSQRMITLYVATKTVLIVTRQTAKEIFIVVTLILEKTSVLQKAPYKHALDRSRAYLLVYGISQIMFVNQYLIVDSL